MEEVGQKVYVRDEEHEWLPADMLDRNDEGGLLLHVGKRGAGARTRTSGAEIDRALAVAMARSATLAATRQHGLP